MEKHLQIKNWDRWQSYRADRGQPPWIKIHRCVMRNPEWVALTDAERGQLVSMWLLAADNDGKIPSSPELIQKLCFMSNKIDLKKFIELDFICQGGVKVTSKRRQDDKPEKSRIDKKENTALKNADVYFTKNKKRLTGKRLETFMLFWEAFNFKRGKAEAADAWLNIPELTDGIVERIVLAAKSEAERRPDLLKNKRTPKMAQGWLSGKRWEDEVKKVEKRTFQQPSIEELMK